ncbi:hypothetical protein ABZ904_23855 [Streptomyces sp. NPDC046900]|uniref:hypothetical protein n=1 Tax=Streptomyces sp. NPDC046900 TaxID=3155473 RepID=UPI0033E7C5C7
MGGQVAWTVIHADALQSPVAGSYAETPWVIGVLPEPTPTSTTCWCATTYRTT